MFRLQNVACVALAVCALVWSKPASAETWNAYDGFIAPTAEQSTSDLWQYLANNAPSSTDGDNNSGYTFLKPWGSYWRNVDNIANDTYLDQYVGKNTDAGEIQLHPFAGIASVIAWMSPIAGTVDVSFSVTDRNGDAGDGVQYWLYKSGASDSAYLEKGSVSNGLGNTSGTVTDNNISVAIGDMLYLRVGPNANMAADMTGVTFSVTTSAVPEPSTLVLLSAGLIGLLCYAWRKRKFA